MAVDGEANAVTTLLIDGDPIGYQCSFSNEQNIQWEEGEAPTISVDEDKVVEAVDSYIEHLKQYLGAAKIIVALSCPTVEGWRRKILPTYKSNRDASIKPLALVAARKRMIDKWKAYVRPELEADDILGILATHRSLVKGDRIVVSIDKDLLQVPGKVYNPTTKIMKQVKLADADRLHMMQALMGDPVDGYTGIRGIGPAKAKMLFANNKHMADWDVVRVAYGLSGLTEEDALVHARVSRILRASDYDFKEKKVKLWTP